MDARYIDCTILCARVVSQCNCDAHTLLDACWVKFYLKLKFRLPEFYAKRLAKIAICSGVMPQQPPMISAPKLIHSCAVSA